MLNRSFGAALLVCLMSVFTAQTSHAALSGIPETCTDFTTGGWCPGGCAQQTLTGGFTVEAGGGACLCVLGSAGADTLGIVGAHTTYYICLNSGNDGVVDIAGGTGTYTTFISLGTGDDFSTTANGADTVDGYDGVDTITTNGGDDTVTGGDDNDTINTGDGNDTAYGDDDISGLLTGDDNILGGTGDDDIFGGPGDDILDGESGADKINGDDGNDQILGGSENDVLNGGDGCDSIDGEGGNDQIDGGLGNDSWDGTTPCSDPILTCGPNLPGVCRGLCGGAGDDTINGGDGEDCIDGGSGNDPQLNGDADNDVIFGASGSDTLDGGTGNDILNGGGDPDTIRGGSGDDHLNGNQSVDFLVDGEGGTDECVWVDRGFGDYTGETPLNCENTTYAAIDNFDVIRTAQGLAFQFSTITEVGTSGYSVYMQDGERLLPLHKGVMTSLQIDVTGAQYAKLFEVDVPQNEHLNFVVKEHRSNGEIAHAGVFSVDMRQSKYEDLSFKNKRFVMRQAREPLSPRKPKIDFSSLTGRYQRLSGTDSDIIAGLKLETSTRGLYEVRYDTIADALDMSVTDVVEVAMSGDFKLEQNGLSVPYYASESGVVYYADQPTSIFGEQQVTFLKRESGELLSVKDLYNTESASGLAMKQLHFEENRFAGTAIVDNAVNDYWFFKAMANDRSEYRETAIEFEIDASVIDTEANVESFIELGIQGASTPEVVQTYDVLLNGEMIDSIRILGAERRVRTQTFNASQLQAGLNTIILKATAADDVQAYSYLDYAEIVVPTHMAGVNTDEQLIGLGESFELNDAAWLFDLNAGELYHAEESNADVALELGHTYFAADMLSTDVAVTTMHEVEYPEADYLIISPKSLAQSAGQYADFRTEAGLQAAVVYIEDIYNHFGRGYTNPDAIRHYLRKLDMTHGRLQYVLLLGSGHYDYRDIYGNGAPLVAPKMISNDAGGLASSDQLIADIYGADGVADVAIGRLPVSSNTEVVAYLNRIRAYETSLLDQTSTFERDVFFLADEADYSSNFSIDVERLVESLPADISSETLFADELQGSFADALSAGLNGAGYFNYVGHAGLDRLMKNGQLSPEVLRELHRTLDRDIPVMTAMTCNAGQFAHPRVTGFSEQAILGDAAIALSVFAPSGVTVDSDNQKISQFFFAEGLHAAEGERLGDVTSRALAMFADENDDGRQSFLSYNLLGDPAMPMPVVSGIEQGPTIEAPSREGGNAVGKDWMKMLASSCAQTSSMTWLSLIGCALFWRRRRD